jgi:pimeloyl-ACP methyl ester carboxylesterase
MATRGVERTATRIIGFTSSEMDFQLMRMLGAATAGGGAPGEIFAARAKIADDDPSAWPTVFAARAADLQRLAAEASGRGHGLTAAGHLLRASSYFRSAEYFSDPFAEEGKRFGVSSRDTFVQSAAFLPHAIEPIDIPFARVNLPGYFLRPAGGAKDGKTVVVLTGFDGTGEELYFQTAADGLARGFNVLIAEGPGQMGCLRRNPNLLFRPDYEVPIGAILDFALARTEVAPERLALYGISFGGYFALRAGAHDRRIKALVANSPIIDLFAYIRGFSPDEQQANVAQDVTLDSVDKVPDQAMPRSMKLTFKWACRRFGVTSLSGWYDALKAYRVVHLDQIRCPMLGMVGVGEGDEARRQYDVCIASVGGPTTGRVFNVDEGADMHCQLGNLPLSNAAIYDWLEETFGAR